MATTQRTAERSIATRTFIERGIRIDKKNQPSITGERIMINIWLSGYLMALAVECILKKRYVLAFYMSLGALLSLYLGVK